MPVKVCAVATSKLTRSPTPGLGGLLARQLDRLGVVVRADDGGARVRLGEQHRRGAEAAAEVGDPGPGGQLRLDPVQRRDPVRHQLGHVAGPVERVAADEDVLVVLVPGDAGAGAERLGDLRFGAQIAQRR